MYKRVAAIPSPVIEGRLRNVIFWIRVDNLANTGFEQMNGALLVYRDAGKS